MAELVSREYRFNFGQIMVFDASEEVGLDWEDEHEAQGFVRTDRAAHVALHGEPAASDLRVIRVAALPRMRYESAVSTPIELPTGRCVVSAADDREGVRVTVEPGRYRLYVGQAVVGGSDHSEVDVWLVRPDPLPARSFIHTVGHPEGEPHPCREDAAPAEPG